MKIRRTAAVALAAAGLLTASAGLASGTSNGPDAVGLYNGGTRLLSFDTDRPERAKPIGTVSGLSGDTSLIGIDRRVQNGKLYGVGNQGGIYTLSTGSAKATKVGQLSVALNGTLFGVDFNPAANALRIVSNTGQNLRQPFGTTDGPTVPTVTDGPLSYPATPTTPATTPSGVTAAAYTNNDLNADTATTLFVVDTTLDQVAIQSPANAGSLAATGKLGVPTWADAGFDIYSDLSKGKTKSVKAFAAFGVGGRYTLNSIDLLTGAATNEGRFNYSVRDIAVNLDR